MSMNIIQTFIILTFLGFDSFVFANRKIDDVMKTSRGLNIGGSTRKCNISQLSISNSSVKCNSRSKQIVVGEDCKIVCNRDYFLFNEKQWEFTREIHSEMTLICFDEQKFESTNEIYWNKTEWTCRPKSKNCDETNLISESEHVLLCSEESNLKTCNVSCKNGHRNNEKYICLAEEWFAYDGEKFDRMYRLFCPDPGDCFVEELHKNGLTKGSCYGYYLVSFDSMCSLICKDGFLDNILPENKNLKCNNGYFENTKNDKFDENMINCQKSLI
ncbi:hypothetical protein MHBO_000052 [Bonamia ostreae]|uniref:Uncharacterized protein n=1 Tax=Bonamia ostreae TaxID=126728 RepID=A0ABV2AE64_9EUKA